MFGPVKKRRARSVRLEAARKLGTHTQVEWCELVAACKRHCPRCGNYCEHFDKDHIVSIYAGGSDAIGNIQPLCANCNASKGREQIDWVAEKRGQ